MTGLVLATDSFSKQLSTYFVQRIVPDLEDTSDTASALQKRVVWEMENQTVAILHVEELQ